MPVLFSPLVFSPLWLLISYAPQEAITFHSIFPAVTPVTEMNWFPVLASGSIDYAPAFLQIIFSEWKLLQEGQPQRIVSVCLELLGFSALQALCSLE